MLDHALDELLLAHLKTVPALATLHDYTGQDNADHKLPALTVSTTSEPLAGSDTAFRGEVGVAVERRQCGHRLQMREQVRRACDRAWRQSSGSTTSTIIGNCGWSVTRVMR